MIISDSAYRQSSAAAALRRATSLGWRVQPCELVLGRSDSWALGRWLKSELVSPSSCWYSTASSYWLANVSSSLRRPQLVIDIGGGGLLKFYRRA